MLLKDPVFANDLAALMLLLLLLVLQLMIFMRLLQM